MTDEKRNLIVLTYLASNGKLMRASRDLGINSTTISRALSEAGVLSKTQCTANCCTAEQSKSTIDNCFAFASKMDDQQKAQRLIDRLREHYEAGKARLNKSREWIPQVNPDGSLKWFEHFNVDAEAFEKNRRLANATS